MSDRRRAMIVAAAGLLLVAGVWLSRNGAARTPAQAVDPAERDPGRGAAGIPRIGLDRLEARREPPASVKRDIFDFGRPPAPPVVAETSPAVTAPPALPPAQPVETAPLPPPPPPGPPPLNVKYIGSVENKAGLRVAIFMSDKKEIFTGREGDVVANRIKIVKIGFESVDIQDVGSDRPPRRLPLKGGN